MNALKADPRTIDLRALAPHFYSLSERVLELFEEEEMVDVLSNVCLDLPFPSIVVVCGWNAVIDRSCSFRPSGSVPLR